jgi:DNA-binding MarR family transcriptional regulator
VETTPVECAREVLDVVPLVMRAIRAELRRHRSADLTLAQFRALAFVNRQGRASLSEVAEALGLSLPSMSKMVDGLVGRGFMTRIEDPADRRRVVLALTEAGNANLQAALDATETCLAQSLVRLPEDRRRSVVQAMAALREVFSQDSYPIQY